MQQVRHCRERREEPLPVVPRRETRPKPLKSGIKEFAERHTEGCLNAAKR